MGRIAQCVWACLIAIALASCSSISKSNPSTNILYPGDNHGLIISVPSVAYGKPLTTGRIIICLSKAGTATLTKVDVIDPHAIRVTGFAVQKSPYFFGKALLGEVHEGLAAAGFNPKARAINLTCDLTGRRPTGYELGIELQRTAQSSARLKGFVLHYRAGNGTGTLHIPFGLNLCPAQTAAETGCQATAR
jgi:hypothetical protein